MWVVFEADHVFLCILDNADFFVLLEEPQSRRFNNFKHLSDSRAARKIKRRLIQKLQLFKETIWNEWFVGVCNQILLVPTKLFTQLFELL